MEIEMWLMWGLMAAIFIAGELILNGSFFLWLAFGSAVSCILALLETPASGQAAVFINLSFILILLERRFKERYRLKTREELSENKDALSIDNRDQCLFRKKRPCMGDSFLRDCIHTETFNGPFPYQEPFNKPGQMDNVH